MLSYCKDDRAMRPIHGCPQKFQESLKLNTPMVTFLEICNGLLFRSILRMCVENLKFVALPEIIGGTPKIWAVRAYAHASFSPKFLMAIVQMDPVNVSAKFAVCI